MLAFLGRRSMACLFREIFGNMAQRRRIKPRNSLDRPVMGHPDFQASKLLVSDCNVIVGLFDLQIALSFF